jgi:hypothetical protein
VGHFGRRQQNAFRRLIVRLGGAVDRLANIARYVRLQHRGPAGRSAMGCAFPAPRCRNSFKRRLIELLRPLGIEILHPGSRRRRAFKNALGIGQDRLAGNLAQALPAMSDRCPWPLPSAISERASSTVACVMPSGNWLSDGLRRACRTAQAAPPSPAAIPAPPAHRAPAASLRSPDRPPRRLHREEPPASQSCGHAARPGHGGRQELANRFGVMPRGRLRLVELARYALDVLGQAFAGRDIVRTDSPGGCIDPFPTCVS